ncbi:alpha/beta fold hydrolase [Sinomonas sp. ASV322]|uniref:alpha/beta hydrolase n=1 Tax=Sinomonas sp. ASV322 TaxID=3041920 RepID=UPI0027DBD6DD|nr:alpha/beta fold hydrolase [Sinomonas sp. ASV322]MDQ4501568.1 alpha/beta fold hydrolase [Sinomonas sp. ASV322]
MTVIRPFQTIVDGLCLRGTHYSPPPPEPGPTAVLFHGFGNSRVETTCLFVTLARRLAATGIGVIAYDRAGHGESDGEFFDTSVSLDVRQAHDVLAAIADLDDVDAGNLHLVGMSLGSVIASVVAAESALPLRSLTMWSTAAMFADEIRSGTLQGRSLETLDSEGYFDFLGMRMGPAMRDDAESFDVYGRAAAYAGPVRLLHGTADFIPLSYAERYLQVYGERGELIVVEGADHGWAQLPQRDQVIAHTGDFISRHATLRVNE